jgi:hypothetical protein
MKNLPYFKYLGNGILLASLIVFPLAIPSNAETEPMNNYQMGRHDFSKSSTMSSNYALGGGNINNPETNNIQQTNGYKNGRHNFSNIMSSGKHHTQDRNNYTMGRH